MTKKKDAKTVDEKTAEVEQPVEASEPTPDVSELPDLVEELSGPNRRRRQDASHRICLIAREDPTVLLDQVDQLTDALYRPEAQTRWEVLDALSELALTNAAAVADAYDGAEAALFDEGSSTVRLAAFRFLARFGATSQKRSDTVWPLLDEAIQCFHGDTEYRDMLGCLLDFVKGKISKETRAALVDRITFDAESGRGYIKSCSAEIIAASKDKEKK